MEKKRNDVDSIIGGLEADEPYPALVGAAQNLKGYLGRLVSRVVELYAEESELIKYSEFHPALKIIQQL